MAGNAYTAYVWAYFTGDTGGGERISLAVSCGNDALHWRALNGGRPVLSSSYGTRGLRDPFIMRSHDGERFVVLATDLCVADLHGDFRRAQYAGSRYLEIWESDDLVHWGEQRHVLVAGPDAGNAWAPEAHWVPELGEYAVYWSSNLFRGAEAADAALRTHPTYGRMMIATTKDFRAFSEPRIWMDVRRGDGHDGFGLIDATMVRDGDWWYRFVKDERLMTVREERARKVMDPVVGVLPGEPAPARDASSAGGAVGCGEADGWRLIGESIGVGLPNGEHDEHGKPRLFTRGEGPCVFRANPGDVNGYRWYLFIDQPRYHDGPGHYIGFATHDLDDPHGWVPVGDRLRAGIPVNADGGKPRHGAVMPITAAEREALLAAMG